MGWTASTLWWLVAGALVAAELVTGTFYLLMVAFGAAAGALAAHQGLGGTAQLVCAALVGIAGTALWHLRRARAPRSAPAESNRDVNLDIGQPVRVEAWLPDGTARVHYRGSSWSARWSGSGPPQPGELVVVAVRGSELQLAAPTPLS